MRIESIELLLIEKQTVKKYDYHTPVAKSISFFYLSIF